MTISAAKAIVNCIEREGCKHIFCVPGESYLSVLDAIYDSDINCITTRHEGGAAFMAEGYAKASGAVGVAMATRGVGAANLSIGIHTAYQDSTPMVVFLGQVHRHFKGREGFQEVDLEDFFAPITKWAVEIQHAEQVTEIVQRAFFIAKSGRPGPVVISLPEDLIKEVGHYNIQLPLTPSKPAPNSADIRSAIELIDNASKPVIIAGGGVKSSEAEDELLQLANKMNIPVYTAFRRHDIFPNQHHLYAGHLGLGCSKEMINNFQEADLILAIGTRLSEVTTQDYSLIKMNQTLIHIDINYQSMLKGSTPSLAIVADAKEAIQGLLNKMKSENKVQDKGWGLRCHQIYLNTLSPPPEQSKKYAYYTMIKHLQKLIPKDAIITNDAGNFAGWLHRYYEFNHKQTYIGPTSGAMGYGLPAAIGAKLAKPDKTVVSLSGDGGFMMTIQELETSLRHEAPVICIVFNNAMFGTIRMHQEKEFPQRVVGTDLSDISFSNLADVLNINNYFVKSENEFKQALCSALSLKGTTLIEVAMDKEDISVGTTITQLRRS
jgi:acetolactate synthase I/II/III large subunit